MRHVALVIADAGPLITLSLADSLDVLLILDLPIYLVDEVVFEVTHRKELEDAQRLAEFIRDHPRQVHVVDTYIGKTSAAHRASTSEAKLPQNLGELAIQEFASNQLDEIIPPEDPILLLFEDRAAKKVRISDPGVHPLTTKSLLLVLEQLHLIESATAIWTKVQRCGRDPSETEIDDPVAVRLGGSDWRPEQ